MEKILIVGASGLLGNRLMQIYASEYQVIGTYKEHKMNVQNAYELDVTQKSNVARLVKNIRPDVIIDTHGLTNVDYCEANKEEALRINVEGTKNIAESAKETGCRYIFLSTDGLFDGRKGSLYIEADKPNPINYYGFTKQKAEETIQSLDMRYIIARTSTLFGRGGSRKVPTFASWVIKQLTDKKGIRAFTDQYNNPTYTDNLAQFILKLYEKDESGIFHTAGRETISRFEFANKIADVFDLDKNLISPTTTTELNQMVRRPLRTGLDISKAETATSVKGMNVSEALEAFKQA